MEVLDGVLQEYILPHAPSGHIGSQPQEVFPEMDDYIPPGYRGDTSFNLCLQPHGTNTLVLEFLWNSQSGEHNKEGDKEREDSILSHGSTVDEQYI